MLRELREANMVRQREWDPGDDITIEFRGNELGGEVGELQNILKKFARHRMGLKGGLEPNAYLNEVAEELADVVICVDLIAMALGVDLATAVRFKFNATSTKYGLKTRIG